MWLIVPSQCTSLRAFSVSLPYCLRNAARILPCSDYLVGKNRNMTGRYYFSLIRAQQEEYWPCSISLQQSLASTQVSNCQMLDIPQIPPLSESRERRCSAMVLVGFSKWPFWPSCLSLTKDSSPCCLLLCAGITSEHNKSSNTVRQTWCANVLRISSP